MDDRVAIRRKQLIFRSWHRGMRESDLLLGAFAERHVPGFTLEQLERYAELLEHPDPVILDWIYGIEDPPPSLLDDVLQLLMSFRYKA